MAIPRTRRPREIVVFDRETRHVRLRAWLREQGLWIPPALPRLDWAPAQTRAAAVDDGEGPPTGESDVVPAPAPSGRGAFDSAQASGASRASGEPFGARAAASPAPFAPGAPPAGLTPAAELTDVPWSPHEAHSPEWDVDASEPTPSEPTPAEGSAPFGASPGGDAHEASAPFGAPPAGDAYDAGSPGPASIFQGMPPSLDPPTTQLRFDESSALIEKTRPPGSSPSSNDPMPATSRAAHNTEQVDLSDWGFILLVGFICQGAPERGAQMIQARRADLGAWLQQHVHEPLRLADDADHYREVEQALVRFLSPFLPGYPVVTVDLTYIGD